MEHELMTLKDIAQMLGLPESTLRKYRDAYPQSVPYVGSGRERRYREDAVEVFKAIRDCRVDRHLSWEDTERELVSRFPVNADALGKKAAVSEAEANVFLEKLEKAVRQLTSQGERQEFVASTLASELLNMKKAVEKLSPIQDDLKAVRQATYSYNEVVQRQHKEGQRSAMQIMEAIAAIQGALHFMPDEIARAAAPAKAEAVPAAQLKVPAPALIISESAAGDKESETIARLREKLKEKELETEKFRELYVRAKREIDRLRDELKKKTVEEIYGQKRQVEADMPDSREDLDGARGGKLFFRGKKKKP
ncbi:MAG: MerR family transcriptional regulator [bacterium]